MAVIGADPDQLRATANQFVQAADRLQESLKGLNAFISNSAMWRGPDSERFRSEWNGQSVFALNGAINALRTGADILRRNADEQDTASQANGGNGASICAVPARPAPSSAAELLDHIENDMTYDNGERIEDDDGIRIERVVGPDGETRLIVYIKGQDTAEGRGLDRSIGVATGLIRDDTNLTEDIDAALRHCPEGKDTEVMLVGLSQGGMDAQNIAASGDYNVKALVTYGSPLIKSDIPGVHTVHMRAEGDAVPGWGESLSLGRALGSGPSSDYIFTSDPNLRQGADVHAEGYPDVAKDFDQSQDPRFAGVKSTMERFQGQMTVVTE